MVITYIHAKDQGQKVTWFRQMDGTDRDGITFSANVMGNEGQCQNLQQKTDS